MSAKQEEFVYYKPSPNGGYELTPNALSEGKQRIPILFSSKGKTVPLFGTKQTQRPGELQQVGQPRVAPEKKSIYLLGRGEKKLFQPQHIIAGNDSLTPSQTVHSRVSEAPSTSQALFGSTQQRGHGQQRASPAGLTSPAAQLQASLLLSRGSALFPVLEQDEGDHRMRTSQQKKSAPPTHIDKELDQYQVDHMKTVVDKLYGPEIDPHLEYPPGLSSAELFRDVLLEAEKNQAQRLLFVQQKRRLNIMKKLAENLERDLKVDGERIDTFTDNIEKEMKQIDVSSKKRALEILGEEIDEQVKADEQRIAQLNKLEAEMDLSNLIRQNEEVLQLAASDLARGLITKEQKIAQSTLQKSKQSQVVNKEIISKRAKPAVLQKPAKPDMKTRNKRA